MNEQLMIERLTQLRERRAQLAARANQISAELQQLGAQIEQHSGAIVVLEELLTTAEPKEEAPGE